MDWNKVRESVIFAYGEPYDGDPDDEPCFYCPHCGEPVYEEDFPQIDVKDGLALCPVCEEEFG